MKKLFIVYLCSIIVTFPVLSINLGQIDVVSVPDNFPIELTNRILLDLAQNVHNYVGKADPFHDPVSQVKCILRKVSILNKEWYNNLDKQRNDPVATRTLIQNIGITCYSNIPDMSFPPMGIIKRLCTPGAKKCIALSDQLYDENLTPKGIEQLYNDGAILDYCNKKIVRKTVLSYWLRGDNNKSMEIITKLLQLGANSDAYYEGGIGASPLAIALWHNNADKVKLLLSYKAKKHWCIVLEERCRRFIDTFIQYSTKDELTDGLIACIAEHFYLPEIMQNLVDRGANPSVVLPHVFKKIIENVGNLTPNHPLIQKFNFLCTHQAYDQTVCDKVQNLQAIFGALTNKLEDNKVLES